MVPEGDTAVRIIAAGSRNGLADELRPARVIEDWRRSRGLARRLLVRNLRAQYRQTYLGFAWALIPPLAPLLLWMFLQSQRILTVDTAGTPYPVFLLTGLLLWGLFIDAMNAPLRNVSDARAMLAKVHFAREALLIAGLGEVLFHFAIRLLLWGGLLLWAGFAPAVSWPLGLAGIAALLILGTALGVLLTPFGLLYQDIGRGIAIFGQFWFYLTPIVYPPPESGAATWLNIANPVSPLLISTRHWLIADGSASPAAFAIVLGGSLLLLLLSLVVFRASMPIVIERMSA